MCVSLFVENIPKRMHWTGLWHLFARHGEVVATYIARKLSRGGKRFGFVRFKDEVDTWRAMERLNDFVVYGFRLIVKMATQKERNVYSNQRYRNIHVNSEERRKGSLRSTPGPESPSEGKVKRRISGHVEEEDLWLMKRCLVGEMATVCSVSSITSRLEQWGLNGIKVHRMGGKVFILSFEDDELYIMLEDLNWSYLKEIFCRVEAWSEKTSRPHRATWIEVSGLPLHCWNEVTLRRLAEFWGVVEAFGENVNRVIDCEKVTVLISTDHAKRIEESVEIEVGNVIHDVSIVELGFKDTSVDKVSWANKLEQQYRKAESKLEGSSESSSEQDCGTHVVEDEHSDGLEKDAINDLLFGKDLAVNMGKDLGNPDRHIGESDLVGDFYCRDASNSGGGIVERTISGVKTRETATLRVGGDRVEVMDPNNASNSPHQIDLEIPSLKAFEDIHNMGMSHGSEDRGLVVSMEEQTINNQAQDVLVDGSRLGVSEDVENGASFFPEMDYAKQCGKLK
ncbi:hypothetical protein V6N13_095379 [Hibiscus sabdariffa]